MAVKNRIDRGLAHTHRRQRSLTSGLTIGRSRGVFETVQDQKTAPGPDDATEPATGAPDHALEAALEEANLPTLLLCVAQLTGDERWTSEPYVPTPARGPGDHDHGGFSPELQAEIRADALRVITDWKAGRLASGTASDPERVDRDA